MPKTLKNVLTLVLPLAIGGWLVYFSLFKMLSGEERTQMWDFIKSANYFWVIISMCLGWLSHVSRSMRWQIKLDTLGDGIKTRFWDSYHAVMSGYIINLTIPRSGEASRAAILARKEKRNFTKVLGTIIAERAVDVVMLGIIFLLFLYFQIDKIEDLQNFIASHPSFASEETSEETGISWLVILVVAFIALGLVGMIIPKIREKILSIIGAVWEGVTSIFRLKNWKGYIFHTFAIWILYVGMFWVVFLAYPETSSLPIGGVLAGFIAGTIGVIFFPGGVGAYWILVGMVVTFYLFPDSKEIPNAEAMGIGMLIWASQNLLIILAGVISLMYAGKVKVPTTTEE